ncbi:PPT1 [Symbiodinium natans]|uniref:Serine/threonine-protein phosphatase n=1 Tax=Symbiodinium natans TaxID=878477 RepID=A0A812P9G6_9DINO|nr:PPT1 [Symbiodinium natans]
MEEAGKHGRTMPDARAYPVLADWELEAAWWATQMELQNRRLPCIEVCRLMILEVTRMYRQEKNVVNVSPPDVGARIVVVGDLHGHFSDLAHILRENGEPQSGPGGVKYIFNGDFVDRGAWGPEVLLAIYCLKCKSPDCIFLNRGNHEDQQQNLKPDNGFVHSHCIRAFGADAQRMYSLCKASFKVLPLCHVIGKEIAVIHGGLPLDPQIRLADIDAIDRRRAVPVALCGVLGYPRFQKVVSKRILITGDGEEVPAGKKGKLLERVGKTRHAVVKFPGYEEEVLVQLAGCPEHEQAA